MSTRLPRYGLLDKSTGEWLTAAVLLDSMGKRTKDMRFARSWRGEPGAYQYRSRHAELKNLIVRPLIEESVAA
jgi:hypothetical protein